MGMVEAKNRLTNIPTTNNRITTDWAMAIVKSKLSFRSIR